MEAEIPLEVAFSPKTVEPKLEKVELEDEPKKHHHHHRPIIFKEKDFKIRPSLLTTLFEGSSGTVFNFIVGVFILLFLATVTGDIVKYGNPFNHLWLILWNFNRLPITLAVWSLMFASTFLVYAGLKYWSLIPSKTVSLATETPWLIILAGYFISLFYLSLRFLFKSDINCACCFIITCENTRIAMKVYAFVRENIPRGIQQKVSLSDGSKKIALGESSKNWPTPQQFLYFFFCPSFLYRDSYPMTSTRSWMLVAKHGAQALGNWNLVVHEWLYAYVYKDLALLIGGKKGLKLAQVAVFFLSAFFHEYWFGVSLKIFYPIMFVLYFIFGGIFFFVSRLITVPYAWNISLWFNLLIGTGMFVSCYSTEWYARQRCDSYFNNQFIDLIIPRLWNC
uniref:O-acyltransferase n=1 Tax=Panagrolaimus superbus TaxID=310955 RepID=A0A914ZE68_9BILA